MGGAPETVGGLWLILGIAGGAVFYGRFYVQWIVSELRGRSVMPIAFWYMSSVGSVALMVFAVASRSPLGALGQSVNIVIYVRNLVHIWREHGVHRPTAVWAMQAGAALLATTALSVTGWTWWREYEATQAVTPEEAVRTWFWLSVGLGGQALFAGRFIVQWYVTERRRQSVIPRAFWYLSLVAATLQMACFAQRGEWVFAAGMAATLIIYGRNLWLIHLGRPPEEQTA